MTYPIVANPPPRSPMFSGASSQSIPMRRRCSLHPPTVPSAAIRSSASGKINCRTLTSNEQSGEGIEIGQLRSLNAAAGGDNLFAFGIAGRAATDGELAGSAQHAAVSEPDWLPVRHAAARFAPHEHDLPVLRRLSGLGCLSGNRSGIRCGRSCGLRKPRAKHPIRVRPASTRSR